MKERATNQSLNVLKLTIICVIALAFLCVFVPIWQLGKSATLIHVRDNVVFRAENNEIESRVLLAESLEGEKDNRYFTETVLAEI